MIIRLLEERGPMTGAELHEAAGEDGFSQWKSCMRSPRIAVERAGRRYLRLDQKVEGYARLSPSVFREFLTYTVVGLATDPQALQERVERLAAHIRGVSAAKYRLAERVVAEVGARVVTGGAHEEHRFCVLLAGDIVYEMGHDAPRPERSTGRMVRGSDIDLVFILRDDAPAGLAEALDDAVYQQKYRLLINPSAREELDYTVKTVARLQEQVAFDAFKHMVSCKIVDEARLLYGDRPLFDQAKQLLVDSGVIRRLRDLEEVATARRERAEAHLLEASGDDLGGADLYLFYTSEETEEFE